MAFRRIGYIYVSGRCHLPEHGRMVQRNLDIKLVPWLTSASSWSDIYFCHISALSGTSACLFLNAMISDIVHSRNHCINILRTLHHTDITQEFICYLPTAPPRHHHRHRRNQTPVRGVMTASWNWPPRDSPHHKSPSIHSSGKLHPHPQHTNNAAYPILARSQNVLLQGKQRGLRLGRRQGQRYARIQSVCPMSLCTV
jgi:hypothetical protein